MPDYPPPVDRLLTFRDVEFGEDWPDYVAEFGLGPEHVADLSRMVGDAELYNYDEANPLPYAATVHARRALGQLRTTEAIGPLLAAMDAFGEYDDFWTEEMSRILSFIGPPAIPQLAQILAEEHHSDSTRIACVTSLEKIATLHPECRDECVKILTDQLAKRANGPDDGSVNGFIVSALVALRAVDSAPVIEAAFKAGVVDQLVQGDWPHVRHDLGLGPKPPTNRYAGIFGNLFEPRPERRPDPKKALNTLRARKATSRKNRKKR